MKKFLLYTFALIVFCIAWFGFNRAMLPSAPEICGEISKNVDLNFKMDKMDLRNVVLSNTSDADIGPIFIKFKMAGSWKTGNMGLMLDQLGNRHSLPNGLTKEAYRNDKSRKAKKEPDFTHFMKDKAGKEVSEYHFRQTIVEDKSGRHLMKMTYEGNDMAMIKFLKIKDPITLPAKLSKNFSQKGMVTFQPGTYYLDKKIKGFFIPVIYQ